VKIVDVRSYLTHAKLRDGEPVAIRAIRPDDKGRLLAGFGRLSDRSAYLRFLTPKKGLSPAELAYLTEPDFRRHVALVAVAEACEGARLLGVGRYVEADPDETGRGAELALTVVDAHQHLGGGALLLTHLAEIARQCGVARFEAEVLAENGAALRLLEHSGLRLHRSTHSGVVHAILEWGSG